MIGGVGGGSYAVHFIDIMAKEFGTVTENDQQLLKIIF